MGSDRERRHESASNSNFNPRSRMGSDDYAEAIRLGIVNISIHAPRMGSDRLTPLR